MAAASVAAVIASILSGSGGNLEGIIGTDGISIESLQGAMQNMNVNSIVEGLTSGGVVTEGVEGVEGVAETGASTALATEGLMAQIFRVLRGLAVLFP